MNDTKIKVTPELEKEISDYWAIEGKNSDMFKPLNFNNISRSKLIDYLHELNVVDVDSFSFSLYGNSNVPEIYVLKNEFDIRIFVMEVLKTQRMYIFDMVSIFEPLSLVQSVNFKLFLTY
jgi:hypothetical protein